MKLKLKCAAVLAVAGIMVLTGCASSNTSNGGNTTAGSSQANQTTDSKTETPKTDTSKPVELSFFYYDGLRTFKSDSPIWEFIQQQTNIKLKGVAPTTPGGDANEQFNLMLASGDLPDIIHASRDNVNKNNSKLLVPLDELIAEHAPNLKAALDANPIMKSASTGPDGKIYAIPYLPDGQVSETLFIRKDWLDKFDLAIPTTVAEYENALRIFRENDANGNGKKDEIGFFDRENNNGIWGIMNFYGASQALYVKDGVVIDDKYTTTLKDAVKDVARIYAEGLIDPEIYTRGKDSRDYMFQQNIGASTIDWVASTATYQEKYESEIDNLEWIPMLPPAGPDGVVRTEYSRAKVSDWCWGISKSCKDPVTAVKLLDYLFSDEGQRTMNFGVEGLTYDMVDGKPFFKDEVLNGEQPVNNQLQDIGYLQVGYPQDFEYERQWSNELALVGVDLYTEAAPFLDIVPNLGLSYTEEELKLISEKGPALRSYTQEMIQKWVLGSEDVEAGFDKYLEKAEQLGAYDIIAAHQAAYDRAYN